MDPGEPLTPFRAPNAEVRGACESVPSGPPAPATGPREGHLPWEGPRSSGAACSSSSPYRRTLRL